MKHIAIVCCCQRDAAMLPLFIARWRTLYPHAILILGQCSRDPVTDAHGLPCIEVDWTQAPARSLLRAMLNCALTYEADVVWKCDVDAWHRHDFICPLMENENIMAAGIQWLDHPHNFLGIAYAVRRKALVALECEIACSAWEGGEDYAMSWMLRKLFPNQIYLMPPTTARKAQTDDGLASIVHCGSYEGLQDSRKLAHHAMQALSS